MAQTKQGLLALLVASTVLLGAGFGFLAPTDDGPSTERVASPPSTDGTGTADNPRTDSVGDDESEGTPAGESTPVSTPTPTDSRTDGGANDADDQSAANSGGNRGNRGSDGRTLDLRLGLQSGQTILGVENAVPGQTGESVVSVRNAGSLDGRLAASVSVVDQAENGLTDPERRVDASPDRGELGEWLELRVSVPDDDEGRTYLLGSADDYVAPADVGDGSETTVSLSSREHRELLVEWCLPAGAGNEIQSDSVRLEFEFSLVQR
ncbi:hypothetical protein SAMN04487948_105291 [Halogranum amylolyticum]|uniref:SipW-cognate class signal peptide n=1 Tax=Halogranum amylolyticum TaxID=660520 RepID=A0A1H8STF0_9EURY|nr:hypothetical protein [Halogranum amylolyticum]SEO81453.1 hypothetical protein SAMN04487948_105291 [Halogranum amylolyticum]